MPNKSIQFTHSLFISSFPFPVNGHWLFITRQTMFLSLSDSSGMKKCTYAKFNT